MRTLYDFSPLNRSTVGFDRMMDMLANSTQPEQVDNYPPYNIERLNEDSYRIILAVAGFTSDDLVIVAHENQLIVTGRRADDDGVQYLHRGLAARAFERRFNLADFISVKGAKLANGLLSIDLVREVPEAVKPRTINIGTGQAPHAVETRLA
jgi:molecular chaperone IbpA